MCESRINFHIPQHILEPKPLYVWQEIEKDISLACVFTAAKKSRFTIKHSAY